MTSAFQSFDQSPLGAFIESPLGARDYFLGVTGLFPCGDYTQIVGGAARNRITVLNESNNLVHVGGGGANGTVHYAPIFKGKLCAIGQMSNIAGVSIAGAGQWNGTSWSQMAGGISWGTIAGQSYFLDSCIWNNKLVISGVISSPFSGSRIIAWNGTSFEDLQGDDSELDLVCYAVCEHNGKLYSIRGSSYKSYGNGVYEYDEESDHWELIGEVVGLANNNIRLVSFSGDLYILGGGIATMAEPGGSQIAAPFTTAWGGAKWNGTNWEVLAGGSPVSQGVPIQYFDALVHEGVLYLAAPHIGGSSVSEGVLKMDTSDVFGAVAGTGINTGQANCLAIWDGKLAVGGTFTAVDGTTARRCALIDLGTDAISEVGEGINNNSVKMIGAG